MSRRVGRIMFVISGLLVIFVLTACSHSAPAENKVERLDYVGVSQDIKDEVDSYWQKQKLEFKSEMEWGRNKKEMVSGREVSWKKNFQKIGLPFPSSREQELDSLLAGLKDRLTAEDVKVEFEAETSESELMEAELRVKLQPTELKGEELTLYQLNLTQSKVKARMAFIIDDLGFNRDGTAELMEIDRPLTVAVLPRRPYSTSDAEKAAQAGHEILLHLPMEPSSPVSPGKGAIYTDMTTEEIKTTIDKDLASLKVEVAGVNNHMGSKATAHGETMSVVLDYLHQQNLFFIDSSTAPLSVVPAAAREVGEPYGMNYLFIDNIDNKERINKQIKYLADVALKQGELITIGHIKPNTVQALEEMIPQLEKKGIQLVYVSELVK